MKPILTSVAKTVLFAIVLLSGGRAFSQAGQLIFTAHLSGDEETPAVVSNGEGLITVLFSADRTTMMVNGVVSNLSGAVTAAHFHAGAFGVAGGVVLDLSTVRSGNRFSGQLPVPAGFLEKTLQSGIYANVHTSLHPGGEIRGQLHPESDLNFGAVMTGLNEVPTVLTTAFGLGGVNIILGDDKLTYHIVVSGLSGPITAAHIHAGVAGVAGPVVAPLTFSGTTIFGEIALASLPGDFITKLIAGQYYANVHTAAHPGGEIRAQLLLNGYLNGAAILNGAQETPPVATTANGIGFISVNKTLDSLLYGVLVSGLSGPPTAAHVHKGAPGVAGGVVFPLVSSGLVPGVYTATVAANAALITDLINNNLYFNVHTSANPNGEIRGQITTNLRKGYAFDLCASQEMPGNGSSAYGAGMVSVDQNDQAIHYQLMADGLTGPATAAHIHTGNAGVNGPVKFPLSTPAPYSEGGVTITATADATLLESEGMYMNIHTAANPGGEIRGQIRRGLTCSLSTAVFDPLVEELQVYPNPATEGVTVALQCQEAFKGELRLTDLSGRDLQRQTADAGGRGAQKWYVPTKGLAPGMYYLHLESNGATLFVRTIIKQ